MSIRYTALSEIGLKMNENQDGLFCAADGESGIFLVADGMGGHQDGAWASAAIVKKNLRLVGWLQGFLIPSGILWRSGGTEKNFF